ncbi:MAG: L-2-hydroxyglutarate oxidase [Desulfobacterales bacterium]|nr:L-2-hydroxyglutarate oxidase [Desulfobacterales bacterium]MDD4072026.1 L-2-hydroxyglutarate oxidase [Desulfobacterales bacterium]MDD4392603.1 L-2-hydroxyglutarate oxidase [Desulfobacterales bacterium]
MLNTYDMVLVGGGIVGVSTAWQLKQRYAGARILLIEKEPATAHHQTGHNSGVIHAGVYYQPGSLKADFCKRGAAQTIEFCKAHGLPFEQCGKMLVATNPLEYERMESLEKRCLQNGIETERLSEKALKRREPNIKGLAAVFVPATGITDYRKITAKIADLLIASGGEIRTGCEVRSLRETPDGVQVYLGTESIETKYLVACGGLGADRLAGMMHIGIDFQIIPFRGEYYRLPARHNRIVNHLIYPIPDPELPFLGVHLTRMIDGSVTVGPNAVLGWKREGYGRFNLDVKDCAEMFSFPGFWKVVRNNLKSGWSEFRDSLYKPGYLKRIHKYCPLLTVADLLPYPAGIRAQAVKKDGSLVHDFLFAESDRSFHVCNAPSPAATSAMPIGAYLCDRIAQKFDL